MAASDRDEWGNDLSDEEEDLPPWWFLAALLGLIAVVFALAYWGLTRSI